ncbi:GNAT family N-acetyltransferase [Micromonospora siamensis]|uniref:FR47-like protein n=1 Tax=Micromonospora siamensis TaxID=299152 RepID=A0A1C5IIJ2_9ACTN|nr:GNAT family N-acetyltransferase [Micromonospora siamensis]SCG58190.1 FR47-like protein [Micromonospora siamensis]
MPVRAEHDRALLAELLTRDPVLHAYQLGDLDDFFWPYTSWFRRDDQVALLYHGTDTPVLIAHADPDGIPALSALLADLTPLLPARLYAHLSPGLSTGPFDVTRVRPHLRMALTAPRLLDRVTPAGQPLTVADLPELTALYAVAYPGNWFDARMLATGHYVGVRDGGELVAVAGVHVHSPTYRVAALGNVTTHPRVRGRGLAAAAVAAVCRGLAPHVDHVTLNVSADNVAARRLYARLGFTDAAGFTECWLRPRP